MSKGILGEPWPVDFFYFDPELDFAEVMQKLAKFRDGGTITWHGRYGTPSYAITVKYWNGEKEFEVEPGDLLVFNSGHVFRFRRRGGQDSTEIYRLYGLVPDGLY
jgi:hypothetical protein